ncbi:hypothetical protein JCM14076_22570 [Methylosoma difficile]
MKHINVIALLALTASLLSTNSQALELLDNGKLSLRGFGTIGGACYTADNYDFSRENLPDGPGKSRRCDPQLDSKLGLQLDAALTDSLQATVQGISYHRADGSFTPELTQANLRWAVSDDSSIRLGRMQTPLFFVSEYRNVLHAQPWVRPPVELYNLVPIYSIDGLEFGHRITWSSWRLQLNVGGAHSAFDTPRVFVSGQTDPIEAGIGYLDIRLEHQAWLFKANLMGGKMTYDAKLVNDLLLFVDKALANELNNTNKDFLLFGFGARYETNEWLLQSEYLFRRIDSFFRDQQGAYLMAGRHFGNWMPYGIVARRWSQSQGKENLAADPFQYAIAKSIVEVTYTDRTSFSLGLSRRLGEQAIVKLQTDFIKGDSGTAQAGDFEQLVTLNLDFVF